MTQNMMSCLYTAVRHTEHASLNLMMLGCSSVRWLTISRSTFLSICSTNTLCVMADNLPSAHPARNSCRGDLSSRILQQSKPDSADPLAPCSSTGHGQSS